MNQEIKKQVDKLLAEGENSSKAELFKSYISIAEQELVLLKQGLSEDDKQILQYFFEGKGNPPELRDEELAASITKLLITIQDRLVPTSKAISLADQLGNISISDIIRLLDEVKSLKELLLLLLSFESITSSKSDLSTVGISQTAISRWSARKLNPDLWRNHYKKGIVEVESDNGSDFGAIDELRTELTKVLESDI